VENLKKNAEAGRLPILARGRSLKNSVSGLTQEYKRFLGNICKPSKVAGLLQVRSDLSLTYLEGFMSRNP
jgi:hypothetical protein